jgi:rsbT antagonist protein RsbS
VDSSYASIPIIKLWHLLLIPLQGEMTDDLANQLMNEVLDRIHQLGCSGLVIDITGLWLVDSHLCSVLSQLSSAAALMGAKTFI